MIARSAASSTVARVALTRPNFPDRRRRGPARRPALSASAILSFSVLLATALDSLAASPQQEAENQPETPDDAGQGIGRQIDELYAALVHGAAPTDAATASADGAAGGEGEQETDAQAISGPLDLTAILAHSIGVSNPAQAIRPVSVTHEQAGFGFGLPAISVGGGASKQPEPAGKEDPGGSGPVLVRVVDEGETMTYRLDPALGTATAVAEDGAEFPLPRQLADILLDLYQRTGRTSFDASELDEGLIKDTDVAGGNGKGAGDKTGGSDGDPGAGDDDSPDGPADEAASVVITVVDGDETFAYRLDNLSGKVVALSQDGAEFELPAADAAPLLALYTSTGRTLFDVSELEDPLRPDVDVLTGPGGAADEDGDPATDEAGDDDAGLPDWFHVSILDGGQTDVFWFDRATGAGYTDIGADGIPDEPLDPLFAAMLLDLVEATGRTLLNAGDLTSEADGLSVDIDLAGGAAGEFVTG